MTVIGTPKPITNTEMLKLIIEKNKLLAERKLKQTPEQVNFCGRIFNYVVNNYTEKRDRVDQYEERIYAQTNLSDLEKIQIVNNEPLNEAELFVLV